MTQTLVEANHYLTTKRAVDSLAAGLLLILLFPLLAGIGLFVRMRLGSPVLFAQQRPGKDEEVFTLYKFRSMAIPNPSRGLVSDQDRITPFGQLLRSTSLDELPSLWNIFKGDMSFVGPRPLLVDYLDRYSPTQRARHLIRPGLTGLAQVRGRNLVAWDERLDLDVEYVARVSWKLDLWILLQTIIVVIKQTGISQSQEEITMEEFFGPMAFPTLALTPTDGLQVPQGIEEMPGFSCGPEFSLPDGSLSQGYQEWVTLRNRVPQFHDWVAVDPVNSMAKAICGLTLIDDCVVGQGGGLSDNCVVDVGDGGETGLLIERQVSREQTQKAGLLAELYIVVLRPDDIGNHLDAEADAELVGFQAVSLLTTRALALGVKDLRVFCAKSNGLMMDPLLQFGFEIIKSISQSSYYLLSFETNLGQSEDG